MQRMFGAIAHRYDLNNRLHSFGLDQRWRRKGVRLTGVDETSEVLDVACGTGDLSECFLSAGAARVTGVDFTPEMLEIAKSRAERAELQNITYLQGDATALELPDNCADIVSIAFGLRNVNDPDRALAELRRVLRPKGRLLILEFARPRNPIIRAGNNLYTNHIMPRTASLLARDHSGAYHYLPRSIETFLDPNAVESAIRKAEFQHVERHSWTFGVCMAYLAS